MKMRKVRSAEEAHDIHERNFSWLLAAARSIAVEIARRDGTAHTRLVREELVRRGIIQEVPPHEAEERWLGTVFRDRMVWEKTGERAPRHSETRNTHRGSEGVNVWRIRQGADLSRFQEVPHAPKDLSLPMRPAKRERTAPRATPEIGLPFSPVEALKDIVRLRRMSAMRGDRESSDFVAMVQWMEKIAGGAA